MLVMVHLVTAVNIMIAVPLQEAYLHVYLVPWICFPCMQGKPEALNGVGLDQCVLRGLVDRKATFRQLPWPELTPT